jgi:hypothetical protein
MTCLWFSVSTWSFVAPNQEMLVYNQEMQPSFVFIPLGLCTIQEWNMLHMITIHI